MVAEPIDLSTKDGLSLEGLMGVEDSFSQTLKCSLVVPQILNITAD